MGYTFRVVFSGPCAYIPNIVEDSGEKAKSWSVILPELRRGWPGDDDGIRVDRHLPVVRYSPEDFNSTGNPDSTILVEGRPALSLVYLKGHRITFDLPGASNLSVEDELIPPTIRESKYEVKKLIEQPSYLLRSMDWLPSMSWLREDLQWFGVHDADYYFKEDDYPNGDVLASHVILKNGALITNEIDTILTQERGEEPTIWDFRPVAPTRGSGIRRQALARSIALEVQMPDDQSASVTIAFSEETKTTLVLKPDKQHDTRTIEIMNRELEEVFMVGDFEVEAPQIDLDFRYLYSHASGYDRAILDYPIPHLIDGGDPGNEAGTCGGKKFSGFASEAGFETKIQRW